MYLKEYIESVYTKKKYPWKWYMLLFIYLLYPTKIVDLLKLSKFCFDIIISLGLLIGRHMMKLRLIIPVQVIRICWVPGFREAYQKINTLNRIDKSVMYYSKKNLLIMCLQSIGYFLYLIQQVKTTLFHYDVRFRDLIPPILLCYHVWYTTDISSNRSRD